MAAWPAPLNCTTGCLRPILRCYKLGHLQGSEVWTRLFFPKRKEAGREQGMEIMH